MRLCRDKGVTALTLPPPFPPYTDGFSRAATSDGIRRWTHPHFQKDLCLRGETGSAEEVMSANRLAPFLSTPPQAALPLAPLAPLAPPPPLVLNPSPPVSLPPSPLTSPSPLLLTPIHLIDLAGSQECVSACSMLLSVDESPPPPPTPSQPSSARVGVSTGIYF